MSVTGPLDGIRVIEVGTLISGPFAGRLLGDMGAEVIKIEPPGAPDPLRTWGQAELDGHHFFWTVHARNKKAVTLNLREAKGRELFLDLVEKSDIIVENFRPGTLEKWNLGYDVLRERNRGIILVRVSGYGQTGPEAHKAGYASVAEAASGLRHMNGFPGGPPPRLALSLGDSLAGMFAAQGALAALYRRTVTGEGQVVDAALTESCLAVQESTIPDYDVGGVVRGPSGTRLEGIAPSNIYRTRRRQLGGDRRQPGHRVPPAVRGDGPAGAGHRRPVRQSRCARAQSGRAGQDHRRLGGAAPARRYHRHPVAGRRDLRADQHCRRGGAGSAVACPRHDRRPLGRTGRTKRQGPRRRSGALRIPGHHPQRRVRPGRANTTTRSMASY